jgi:hypothetical protein
MAVELQSTFPLATGFLPSAERAVRRAILNSPGWRSSASAPEAVRMIGSAASSIAQSTSSF